MAQTKLSTASIKAIGAWTSKAVAAATGMTKVVDSLHGDGITAEMLMAPAKDADRTLYDAACAAVVTGFTAAVQTLLKKDTKSLSEPQKKDKRYWQQQIGSKLKDIRKALSRREALAAQAAQAAQEDESDGAGAAKASWEATVRTKLAEIVKQAQKKESTTIKDLPAFIKDLESALTRIPTSKK